MDNSKASTNQHSFKKSTRLLCSRFYQNKLMHAGPTKLIQNLYLYFLFTLPARTFTSSTRLQHTTLDSGMPSSAWRKEIQCSSVPSTMWITSPNDILWMPQTLQGWICCHKKWDFVRLEWMDAAQKAGETSDLTDSHKGVETCSIVISSQWNRFITLIQTNKRVSQYQSNCITLLTNMIKQDINKHGHKQFLYWQI